MADNMNDQFEHGRIPLKPLSLKNKNLASTCELIVDYINKNKECIKNENERN